MSKVTIKERKSKFNELSNTLNIKLIKGYKKYSVYINKGKNLKTKPIDLSNRNKYMAYFSELLFGILSYSSYIDLQKMKVVFSVVRKK